MSDTPQPQGRVTEYHGPAGGWGALASSLKHVQAQRHALTTVNALLRVNQPDGFDCPGCAWPEPKSTSAFEFCENGVKAVAWESTAKRVTPEFFAQHPVSFLQKQTDHWLESQGRLTHPMRYDRASDRYLPIAWDQAFDLLGQRLRALPHPDRAAFYASGRTSNEAAFLYQLMGRALGTNNFPDCSNLCHESSGVAMAETLGVSKGTVTLDDFHLADAIFVIGQNPGTNHPRMLSELQRAARRGARIVALNPLRERGLIDFIHPQHPLQMITGEPTPLASLYLQVQIGGDLAALTGIAKHLLDADEGRWHGHHAHSLDRDFIQQHTTGFDAFAQRIRDTPWPDVERGSGLTRDELRLAAEVYLDAPRTIVCWAMGLTQHRHAVPTIQMIVNLLLMRGNVGKPGAGACPVRGHSNVQGDRTMGITPRPKPAFLDALQRVFGISAPRRPGLDTVQAIHAMERGEIDLLFALGGNFIAANPDTPRTSAAVARCRLTAHVSTKLNRSHTVPGAEEALILPCLSRTERDLQPAGPQRVTVEDSMSMVHASRGTNPPASEHLLSEPRIVARLARATFGPPSSNASSDPSSKPAAAIPWESFADDYRRVRDAIQATLPELFHDFNARLEQPGGFYLGNSARDRLWTTPDAKAAFTVHDLPDLSLPQGQLRLMTLRSHDQYNTTVYDLDDRYRGIFGTRHVLLLNELDLLERGLRDGDTLRITSHSPHHPSRSVTGFRAVAYDIPRSCAAGYFPELNPLASLDSVAMKSNTPTSKFIPITIERA